jgi:hypothetical protein
MCVYIHTLYGEIFGHVAARGTDVCCFVCVCVCVCVCVSYIHYMYACKRLKAYMSVQVHGHAVHKQAPVSVSKRVCVCVNFVSACHHLCKILQTDILKGLLSVNLLSKKSTLYSIKFIRIYLKKSA